MVLTKALTSMHTSYILVLLSTLILQAKSSGEEIYKAQSAAYHMLQPAGARATAEGKYGSAMIKQAPKKTASMKCVPGKCGGK